MCLSVPALVLRTDGDMAEVSVGGALFRAGLQMVRNVAAGDYVLLHAGFAIQKLDEREALEILELLKELNEAGNE